MKLTVILPTYNEERTVRAILDAVLQVRLPDGVEKEVIVVDDASKDRTAEIVTAEPRAILLRHAVNRGKGAAIHTGLQRATGDIVLIQDADMEYSVSDYPALVKPFLDKGTQVVYGSRFLKRRWPTRMHWANWAGNRFLTFAANVLYGARLTDEATCYKLFRTDLLKSFPLKAEGFDFCPEVTAHTRRRGIRIHEVPIDYAARTHAEGKKVKWTDFIQALRVLISLRFRRAR